MNKKLPRVLFISLAVLAVAAGAYAAWKQLASKPESTFFAKTTYGVVQGVMQEGVNAFLGIPYARPPIGNLRWKAPRVAKEWKTALQTTEIPPHCAQSIFHMNRGQEDCLYLNVWTPTLFPQKPLPVMVWVHGGGFTVGHSYETTPGQRLAQHGNVVVVSMNYRLGAFGFMAHPELTKEGAFNSGNYGVLDQVFALQWVKRNIRHFGGDPDNVTIFGESAGGMSICNLLATPQASGLFHKAIIQSGPCFSPYPDLQFMEQQGLTMQQRLGCDDAADALSCMREKTMEDVIAAMPPPPGMVFGEEDEYWMPNIDGKVFTEQPFVSLEQGRFAQVPVMNGNNANEGSLLVMFGHEYLFRTVTPEVYPQRIRYLVRDDDKVKRVMEKYPLANYRDAGEALSAVFGDAHFACHERWTSDALAAHVPTHSYFFTYPDADFILPEVRKLGAFHSAEVQFLFNDSMAWFERGFSGDELKLSHTIMDYWVQFARTGNPNKENGFHWPEYRSGQRLVLDKQLSHKPVTDTDDTCDFWKTIHRRAFIEAGG